MPLDFLLRLMRDPHAPIARRLEAAKAAATFLHSRLTAIDAELRSSVADPSPQGIRVQFVLPSKSHPQDDQE